MMYIFGLVTAKSTIVGTAGHSSRGFCACCSVAADTHYGMLLLSSLLFYSLFPRDKHVQPQIRKSWDSMENANKKRK